MKLTVTPNIEKRLPLNILRAIIEVNELFIKLKNNVELVPPIKFDPRYTKPIDLTAQDIVKEALNKNITMSVQLYTQNWFAYKLNPVNAYVLSTEPDIIFINTRMFSWNKPIHEWKETCLHEAIHLMDKHSRNTFDHGDNDLTGKGNTAPVRLAQLLATMKITDEHEQQLQWA